MRGVKSRTWASSTGTLRCVTLALITLLQGVQKGRDKAQPLLEGGGRYAEYERKRNQTEKRKAYHAASVSSWRGEDPPKMAVQLARHRVRKLNAEGDFTSEEFEALCEKHGNVCFRCGDGDVLLTPDHVIPCLWEVAATRGRTLK